jgi:hypothetical protein
MTAIPEAHREHLRALLQSLETARLPIDMPTIQQSLVVILEALLAARAPPDAGRRGG